jgi:class 3 adenylate cyclase
MLTFPSARQGVAFGSALQRELNARRTDDPNFALHVRVGVHTGEVLHVDGDLFGRHVNVAARVTAAAGPDEVLVSGLVQEIVSAMGDMRFGAVRETSLRGLDGTFHLFPVESVG